MVGGNLPVVSSAVAPVHPIKNPLENILGGLGNKWWIGLVVFFLLNGGLKGFKGFNGLGGFKGLDGFGGFDGIKNLVNIDGLRNIISFDGILENWWIWLLLLLLLDKDSSGLDGLLGPGGFSSLLDSVGPRLMGVMLERMGI